MERVAGGIPYESFVSYGLQSCKSEKTLGCYQMILGQPLRDYSTVHSSVCFSSSSSSSLSSHSDDDDDGDDAVLSSRALPLEASWCSGLPSSAFCFEEEIRSRFPDIRSIPWTYLLQWVRALPTTTAFASREKEQIFDVMVKLFVAAAEPIARQIIDESLDGNVTLMPDPKFGGIAGGKKYCVGTLLFKFAMDVELSPGSWLYGGAKRNDRLAMKSAGHELKSTQALLDAGMTQLNFALMVVFTYRGKRVMCASLLPVKGQRTLLQGKDDVRGSMKLPPPHVEAIMAAMGANLGIGKSSKAGEEIYGPFDMEIHLGVDGLLYVIDPTRLFPPEYRGPQSHGNNIFYELLRPELLQGRDTMVLPDAIQLRDPKALQDLIDMTRVLDDRIREVGQELQQGGHEELLLRGRSGVKELLHSRGINMRHLPSVLKFVADEERRDRIERICGHRSGQHEMDVKIVRYPRQRTEDELRQVLLLQEASLIGPARMQMIPTLLQLSALVGDTIPIPRVPLFNPSVTQTSDPEQADHQGTRPSGPHPLVRALDICLEADAEFSHHSFGVITGCSPLSLNVIFELVKKERSSDDVCEKEQFAFPSKWALREFLPRLPPSFLHDRIKRFFTLGGDGDLHGAMKEAALRGRWDLVRLWADEYNVHDLASIVAAEAGNVDLVTSLMSTLSLKSRELTLLAACREGKTNVIAVFLDDITSASLKSQGWQLALIAASQNGHLAIVTLLLNRGVEAGAQDVQTGLTALMAACRCGHLEITRALLERGADPNTVDKSGRSALYCSPPEGVQVVRLLAEFKASFDIREPYFGATPLAFSCFFATEDVIRALCDMGAKVNDLCGPEHYTALLSVARRGHVGIGKVLIEYRADVNAQTTIGRCALMTAATYGCLEFVRLLLDHGAKIDLIDQKGMTALHIAQVTGSDDIVQLLLERGAALSKK